MHLDSYRKNLKPFRTKCKLTYLYLVKHGLSYWKKIKKSCLLSLSKKIEKKRSL